MIFKRIQPEIRLKEVKRLLGNHNNNQLDNLITTIIKRAYNLIIPVASFKKVATKKEILTNISFQQNLNNKSEIFLFAVSIGDTLEKKVASLFEAGNYSQATILDAAGSVAVEDLRNKFKQLAKRLTTKNNLYLGQHYSPGCGIIKLKSQAKIVSILDGEKIGLSVNQHNLLQPEKSITAIIDITAKKRPNKKTNCLSCNLKDCQYRKELDQCQK